MVENVRWRESRKGKRFALAEFSDSSGQFSASCFDEGTAQQLMDLAKESACLLLNVEMDMRAGDETPRLAVRSAKPLSAMVAVARLKMQMDVTKPEAFPALAAMVSPLKGGKCELVINTRSANNKPVQIVLGRQFLLDAELVDQLQLVDGISNVVLAPLGAPRMQLV
jgi:DNA polymerase III subunit alpha